VSASPPNPFPGEEPEDSGTVRPPGPAASPYMFNSRGFGSHQAIAECVRPGTTVLDVGCSSGYMMTHLQDSKGCTCVGIEPSRDTGTIARNAGLKVIVDDALSAMAAMVGTDRFDHIIFGDVLEHLVDPLPILMASHSLLQPSGTIIVSLPNIVSFRARFTIAFGVWRYREYGVFDRTHLRFYNVKTGRELIREGGFEIIHEEFVGPVTFWGGRRLKSVTSLWPNLLGNQMIFSARPTTPLA
jgi:methionine biosynthesis protein MetW